MRVNMKVCFKWFNYNAKAPGLDFIFSSQIPRNPSYFYSFLFHQSLACYFTAVLLKELVIYIQDLGTEGRISHSDVICNMPLYYVDN